MGRKRERTNNDKDELGWGEDYKIKKKKERGRNIIKLEKKGEKENEEDRHQE